MEIASAERAALNWLASRDVRPVSLKRMAGYTNHVFLVKQDNTPDSVLRLANHGSGAGFCPLAHDTLRVCAIHQQAADLGLAPALMATDGAAGIMWLEYAGEPGDLTQANAGDLQNMLLRLHRSGLNWIEPAGQVADRAGLGYLTEFMEQLSDPVVDKPPPYKRCIESACNYAGRLYQQGVQRAYADYPAVPVHSDLNPGNCLFHKARDRWFIIDWDYAGMRVAEWDYAGLIVEHSWTLGQSRAFVPPEMITADLIWFCTLLALMSWHWHFQRESVSAVLQEKWRVVEYWVALSR